MKKRKRKKKVVASLGDLVRQLEFINFDSLSGVRLGIAIDQRQRAIALLEIPLPSNRKQRGVEFRKRVDVYNYVVRLIKRCVEISKV